MDKCTTGIKDLLEILLAHTKILIKLREIFKRYNISVYGNSNLQPITNNTNINILNNINNNTGINSHSGTFISNGNNNGNLIYQQNFMITPNSGVPFNSRDSNTSLFINNLSNNFSNNNVLNFEPKTINNVRANTVTSQNNNSSTNLNNNSCANVNNYNGFINNNYNNSNNNIYSPNLFYVFNEEDYYEIIEDSEKLSTHCEEILDYYSSIEFFKFSFSEIISQANEDINTLKCLFITYQSTLNLDAINSISNMLCARQYIENLKIKFSSSNKSFYDLKLYLFYIQFFLDNSHKINFLFKCYFENKKNQLLNNIQNSNFFNDFKIKDELFCFKTEQYCERYIKKCNDENIELSYFLILFEKKKFLDFPEIDSRKLIIRNFYLSKYQMFIDNDDDLGLLAIFHTNGEPYKNILNEILKEYKHSNNNESRCYFHTKSKLNLHKLLMYSISNYIFIAVKFKEKTNDSNIIENLCKDMRYRFSDMHIFKTLFL